VIFKLAIGARSGTLQLDFDDDGRKVLKTQLRSDPGRKFFAMSFESRDAQSLIAFP